MSAAEIPPAGLAFAHPRPIRQTLPTLISKLSHTGPGSRQAQVQILPVPLEKSLILLPQILPGVNMGP